MMDKGYHKGEHEMAMDCCQKHMMSKEHLMMKKKMLEEKLKWITEAMKKAK
jgi:hypothetical protein